MGPSGAQPCAIWASSPTGPWPSATGASWTSAHPTELRSQVRAAQTLYAGGRLVMPGFVDPHTHLVWAGERADEFEMRVAGASYMEIMAAGGGIMSTVRHTRAASVDDLVTQTRPRLEQMLAHGTTTVEIKTGYGLNIEDELKQLEAIRRLQAESPATIVPTFLGAHAIPAEYKGREDEYVDLGDRGDAARRGRTGRSAALLRRLLRRGGFFAGPVAPHPGGSQGAGLWPQDPRGRVPGAGRHAAGRRAGRHLGRPPGLHARRRDRTAGPVGDHRRGAARHALWPGPPRLYPGAGAHRRRRRRGPGHRLQPRHLLVRVDATHDRPGLPLHGHDARRGHQRRDPQRRPRRRPGRTRSAAWSRASAPTCCCSTCRRTRTWATALGPTSWGR